MAGDTAEDLDSIGTNMCGSSGLSVTILAQKTYLRKRAPCVVWMVATQNGHNVKKDLFANAYFYQLHNWADDGGRLQIEPPLEKPLRNEHRRARQTRRGDCPRRDPRARPDEGPRQPCSLSGTRRPAVGWTICPAASAVGPSSFRDRRPGEGRGEGSAKVVCDRPPSCLRESPSEESPF